MLAAAYPLQVLLTIKSECLRRMIFFGEFSFRRACALFLEHCRVERAHQGPGNERIERTDPTGTGDVECTERLGGLLKHYRRAARVGLVAVTVASAVGEVRPDEATCWSVETPGPSQHHRFAASPCADPGWWSFLFSDMTGNEGESPAA